MDEDEGKLTFKTTSKKNTKGAIDGEVNTSMQTQGIGSFFSWIWFDLMDMLEVFHYGF